MINKLKWVVALTVLLAMVMINQSLYAAGLQIISPNVNVYWGAGSNVQIKWTYQELGNIYVKIELLKSGNVIQVIKPSWPIGVAGQGMVNWYIPPNMALGGDFRIRITALNQSAPFTDVSDFNFSIIKPIVTLITPNGGEKWPIGTQRPITWTTSGFPPGATLKTIIHCNKVSGWDNKVNLILIATPLPTNSYTWTVGNFVPGYAPNPLTVGDDYYLRVFVITADNTVMANDISNANFSITPKLHIPQVIPNAMKKTIP